MHSMRRAVFRMLVILTSFALRLVFTSYQVRADSPSCEQIKTACRNAGFIRGGGARDGLLLACFNPIVHGTTRPRAASIPLPAINPQLVNACRAGNASIARRGACGRTPGACRRRSDRL